MEVWSLVGKITMDGFDKASSQLSSLENKIKANEKAFANLRKAGIALIAMTAAIAGGALKAAIDFETAFAGVKKTVNATEEEFAALKQEIRGLSKELPVSATEIAGVAEAAGQLGIATGDIKDFTEVMVKLGMATNLSADEAATALARFANITGLAAKDYENLGAAIVDLGNNSATTESEIVDMAMRIAGAGTTAGLTQQQILALSAALSSMGLRAEAGGTAISQVFLTMNSAVLSGGEELKKFADIAGKSSSDFAAIYRKDASAALIEFISGLGRMNDSGEDASGALEELGLGGIRITDTMLRASNAQGILTDSIKIANDAWAANSALQEEVDKRNETLASKLTIAKNKVIDMAVSLGDALIPMVTKLLEFLSPIIDKVADWIEKNKGLATVLLGLVGSGGALLLFAGLLPKIVSGLGQVKAGMILLNKYTKIGTAVQWLWNAALAANPVGLVIVAVAALAAAVFSFYKAVTEFFKKTGDSAEEAAAKYKVAVAKANHEIYLSAQELTETIKAELAERLEAELQAVDSKRTLAKNEHDDAIKDLRAQYGLEEDLLDDYVMTFAEAARDNTQTAKDALDEEVDAAQQAYDNKIKSLNKEMEAVEKAFRKRMSLIDAEYSAKLKLLDEETRAAIAEQEEGIDAIRDEQDDIDRIRREEDEAERTRQLEAAVLAATTAEEKANAEQDLADYLKKLSEEQADRERQADIDAIQNTIENIRTEAEAKEAAIVAEQEAKEAALQEDYDRDAARIEGAITTQEGILQTTIERIAQDKIALDAALVNELERLATELAALEATKAAELVVIQDTLDLEVIAIKEQHDILVAEELSYQNRLKRAQEEYGSMPVNPHPQGDIEGATTNEAGQQVAPEGFEFARNPDNGLFELVPSMHTGGIVPGSPGEEVPIMALAGERVTPAGASSGTSIIQNITIPGMVIREEADIDLLMKAFQSKTISALRSAGING